MVEYILGRSGRFGVASFVRTVAAPQRITALRRSASRLALLLLAGGAGSLLAQPAFAGNWWSVSNGYELNRAIQYAKNGDLIIFTADIALTSSLRPVEKNLTFNGNGYTLSGEDKYSAFNIDGAVSVGINDLTVIRSKVTGGSGGTSGGRSGSGGGGAGLGGGLYVGKDATVTLSSVNFARNAAKGGFGGDFWLAASWVVPLGGGGGGGRFGKGDNGRTFGYGGPGGEGGGGYGGSSPGYNSYVAVAGEFGGGGGGAAYNNGQGANGGFGGGGGGSGGTGAGRGGFGGGDGFKSGGGGGAGLGGAIFVREGGQLIINGALGINDNQVFGGAIYPDMLVKANPGLGLGSGLFLQGNGTFTFAPEAGRTQTISDTVVTEGGAGGTGDYVLIKSGGGTTILTAANAYTGRWQVQEGTLQGQARSLVTDIDNRAEVVFDQSSIDPSSGSVIAGTYGHVISGSGGLTKTGVGTLTLTGNNTYTGATTIRAGELLLGSSTVLPSASAITLDGGRLGVEGISASIGNAITVGSSAGSGFYAGAGGQLVVNGVVSGGQLAKTGAGEVKLTGANTFNGANVTAGTLRFSTAANLGAATGVIAVSNASIGTTLNSSVIATQALHLQGKASIEVGGSSLTWNGTISGSGALVKTGAGELSLTGVNSYEGGTSILGGSLTPTSDAALGSAGSLLTLGGGALIIRQNFETARPVAIDGGTFQVSEGRWLTLNGVISGGSLTINGEGTLELTNSANTYNGGNYIQSGRLRGSSEAIRGDIVFRADDANVTFDQSRNNGSFSGNISGPGTLIKTGRGFLKLTGANSYTGGTIVEQGSLYGTWRSLQGDILNRTGVVFDQNDDGTYSGTLTGDGVLTKQGSGRLSLTGTDTVGGGTIINAGTLAVNGTLVTPTVVVNAGGTLAGAKNVEGEVDLRGGTIAPGNSIGTIQISDDLTMAPESDYTVEINGSASDRIEVGGSATILSSTFEIQRYDTALSPVLPGITYTILTTQGGLTVQSPTVAIADFPFLNFTLSEDGFNGYLTTSRSGERFAELASTPNEVAVANVLDSIGSGAAWEQVVGASEAQARSAFASLSNASFHASVLSVLSNQSHFLRDAVINRLADSSPGQLLVVEGLSAAGGSRATRPVSAPAYAMWGQVLGSWGTLNGNSNAARVTDQIGGLVTGVDVSVADTWRFGIAGGYSYTSFDASDIAASGSADSYHVALYGGWQSEGWSVRGGAAYSWNDIDTSRQVAVVGLSGVQDGGYDLGTTQLFAEGAYKFVQGSSTFEPFANLAYVLVDGDVSERGLFATSGSAQMDTTYTTLGLRASTILMERLTARGTLGWRHAFGDVTPEVSLAFDTGGSAFGLTGAPIAVDALVAELGVDYALSANATLSVTYSGQYGSDAYENSAQASLTWRF